MEENRVTVIVGVPHSGTTILYRLLGRHPSLAWFSQFSQRQWDLPGRFPLPFAGLYNRLGRWVFSVPYRKKRGLGEYVVPRPMEANTIWEKLIPPLTDRLEADPPVYAPEDLSEGQKETLREVVNTELQRWNRSHLITKLPRLSRAVLLLDDVLPMVRFVHVIRDGRAVALSNRHKFERQPNREDPLRASALHWRRTVEWLEGTARPRLNDDQFARVKLETVQATPDETLRGLLDYLELDPDRYPFPLPELKTDTNRKWLNRATPEERRTLRSLLGETLNNYNYDPTFPET